MTPTERVELAKMEKECEFMKKVISLTRREALLEAAAVVIDYRHSGQYKTGHAFMTDLDTIVSKIQALADKEVGR